MDALGGGREGSTRGGEAPSLCVAVLGTGDVNELRGCEESTVVWIGCVRACVLVCVSVLSSRDG